MNRRAALRMFAVLASAVSITIVPGAASVAVSAGQGWTVDPISLSAYDTTQLTGLDCSDSAADGACVAAGSVTDTDESHHVVVQRRTGSGWTDESAVEPRGASDAELSSISCVSADRCFAVGRAAYGRSVRTVIERSKTAGWRLQSRPEPPDATVSELSGISCVSITFCVAVGDAGTRTTRSALIETWDGTAWHLVDAPDSGLPSTQLLAVDCTSPMFCVAVGGGGPSATTRTSTVQEMWNGTAWTVGTARRGDTAELTALDCTSSSFCLAVGDRSTYRGDFLVGERWNGTSWVDADPASPSGFDPRLRGISCTSTTYCLAVGTDDVKTGVGAFARIWNGSAFAAARQPSLPVLAVRCFSAGQCEGVGLGAESFDGSQWQLESSQNHVGATRSTRLTAVSCLSPTSCVAMGEEYYDGVERLPMAVLSNGSSWQAGRDQPAADVEAINAVSCGGPAPESCVSSGYYQPQSTRKTIVQRFDGYAWAVEQGVPDVGASQAVSCAASFCVVTGIGAVAIFDGTSWTSMPITGPDGAGVQLFGVDCLSADDCVLVGGYYGAFPNVESALVERWDGTAWNVVDAPRGPSGAFNTLEAVTCSSSTSCVAVGIAHGSADSSLVFRWNGTAWASIPHPATGGGLTSVACASGGSCVAVGPDGAALASTHGTWARSHVAVPPGDVGALPTLTGITYRGGSYHAVGWYDRLGERTALAESLPG